MKLGFKYLLLSHNRLAFEAISIQIQRESYLQRSRKVKAAKSLQLSNSLNFYCDLSFSFFNYNLKFC